MKRLPTFKPHLRDAIREGRKTQTLRQRGLKEINKEPGRWGGPYWCEPDKSQKQGAWQWVHNDNAVYVKCPYPKPGELAVMPEPICASDDGLAFYSDDSVNSGMDWPAHWDTLSASSLLMPANYGRLKVRITAAEPHRLHEITAEQAIAEGVKSHSGFVWHDYMADLEGNDGTHWFRSPRNSFLSLFASIHGQELTDSNPWVWRLAWEAV